MMPDEGSILTQCDKRNSNPTINEVLYKPPERGDEQSDPQKAVKQWHKASKTEWREDLTLADEYSLYIAKFINKLTQLESI